MLADSKKISIRQAAFLFLTICFTPIVRLLPIYAGKRAKEAAWLVPFSAVVMLILIAFIWQVFCRKYKSSSLMDIYSEISGVLIGKIISSIYLIWLVILTALYVRYFSIRFLVSIYPDVNINIFIALILFVIAYTIRNGLITLARFNEMILPVIIVIFYLLVILMLPNVKIGFLTPITYRSLLPIFSGSIGAMGILAYFTFVFIIGDRINNKEDIKKIGISLALFLFIAMTIVVAVPLGIFSYSVVQRTQVPFLIAVKQISILDVIEKFESIVVVFWVLSDFVLISFFIICSLHILEKLFKLSDTKPFINIHLIFIFIFSNYFAKNSFEMEKFSENIAIPINIALGIAIPIIMFFTGKIRKKI